MCTPDMQRVEDIIRSNRRVSVAHIAQELGISVGSAHFIVCHQLVQIAVLSWLRAQVALFYRQGIKRLVERSDKCLQRLGDYVEQKCPVCVS